MYFLYSLPSWYIIPPLPLSLLGTFRHHFLYTFGINSHQGESCRELTEELIKELGEVIHTENTEEFFEMPVRNVRKRQYFYYLLSHFCYCDYCYLSTVAALSWLCWGIASCGNDAALGEIGLCLTLLVVKYFR